MPPSEEDRSGEVWKGRGADDDVGLRRWRERVGLICPSENFATKACYLASLRHGQECSKGRFPPGLHGLAFQRAMRSGFYIEAVAICERILADRLLSYIKGTDRNCKVNTRTSLAE